MAVGAVVVSVAAIGLAGLLFQKDLLERFRQESADEKLLKRLVDEQNVNVIGKGQVHLIDFSQEAVNYDGTGLPLHPNPFSVPQGGTNGLIQRFPEKEG